MTTITNISYPAPQPLTPSTPKDSQFQAVTGMRRLMLALMNNVTAIENFNGALMGTSATAMNYQYKISNEGMESLKNIEEMIQSIGTAPTNATGTAVNYPGGPNGYNPNLPMAFDSANAQSTCLSTYTPQFSEKNTELSSINTFWSGVTNGINQNITNTTQTISLDLQMDQQGPLSTIQTVTQCL